jgi:hypothetical protein
MIKKEVHLKRKLHAFLFSLEAAFSLTLVLVAAAYLFAFAPQKENAGEFLACSDAAGALAELRAFSQRERLQAEVSGAGALLHTCVEAGSAGLGASSCKEGAGAAGEKYSFSFPVWKDGRVENAQVGCHQMD